MLLTGPNSGLIWQSFRFVSANITSEQPLNLKTAVSVAELTPESSPIFTILRSIPSVLRTLNPTTFILSATRSYSPWATPATSHNHLTQPSQFSPHRNYGRVNTHVDKQPLKRKRTIARKFSRQFYFPAPGCGGG